jgi:allatostatin C receptor
VIAWTMSAIFMLPVFLYADIMTATIQYTEQTKVSCIILWPDETQAASQTTFTLYSLILGFAIPLTLILVFYYLVIRKLRTVGPKTKSKEKKRSHRKVTKLVLTVITVYILSWFPYWVSQVALINTPGSPPGCMSRLEITVFVLVGCLGYSNSAMNPVLYAFLSDNFKKSFLKACSCGKEINAQLQVQENSNFFPKFGKRGSDRVCSTSKSPNNLSKANAQNRRNLTQSNQTSTLETATLMIETAAVSRKSSINNIIPSSTTTTTTSLQQSHRTMSDNSLRPPVLHTAL